MQTKPLSFHMLVVCIGKCANCAWHISFSQGICDMLFSFVFSSLSRFCLDWQSEWSGCELHSNEHSTKKQTQKLTEQPKKTSCFKSRNFLRTFVRQCTRVRQSRLIKCSPRFSSFCPRDLVSSNCWLCYLNVLIRYDKYACLCTIRCSIIIETISHTKHQQQQ